MDETESTEFFKLMKIFLNNLWENWAVGFLAKYFCALSKDQNYVYSFETKR